MSEVNVKFGAKDDGLTATISKIKGEMGELHQKVDHASKGIGLSFGSLVGAGAALGAGVAAIQGAFRAAAGTISTFSDALDLGGRLTDLKVRTGESAGNLLVLERAFKNTGMEVEAVGGRINKMQKFMDAATNGGKEQAEWMQRLGVSMTELSGKTPTEQMGVFARHISGLVDPTDRAAAAMGIFGKSGGQLLPLLSNFSGEIDGAKGALGSMPDVMDKSSAAFDQLSDNLSAIKGKAIEIAAGFLEKAMPALNSFGNSLAGIDAAGWGKKMMDMVIRVADVLVGAFKNPMATVGLLGSALLLAAQKFGNGLINGAINAFNWMKSFLSSDMPGLMMDVFGGALKKAFAVGILVLVNGIKGAMEWMEKKIVDIANFFGMDFQASGFEFLDNLSSGLEQTVNEYDKSMVDAGSKVSAEMEKVNNGFQKSTKDFLGAGETSAKMAEDFKKIEESGKSLRESTEKGFEPIKEAPKPAAQVQEHLEKGAEAMKKVKEELTLAEQIAKRIADAQKKNALDKGGKLDDQMKRQLDAGDWRGADRTMKKMLDNEKMALIRGEGVDRDRRSIVDIAKEQGIDVRGKSQRDLVDELAMQIELDPARQKAGKAARGGNAQAVAKEAAKEAAKPQNVMNDILAAIKGLVERIDGKLPLHTLGA